MKINIKSDKTEDFEIKFLIKTDCNVYEFSSFKECLLKSNELTLLKVPNKMLVRLIGASICI